jgi:hypothetical protein
MRMHYNSIVKDDGTLHEKFLPYTVTVDLDLESGGTDTVEIHVDYARANVSIIHVDTETMYVRWLTALANHTKTTTVTLTAQDKYNVRSGYLYEVIAAIIGRAEREMIEQLMPFMTNELNILLANDTSVRQEVILNQLHTFNQ